MCDVEKCKVCQWKDTCAAKVEKPPCYVPKNPDVSPYAPWASPWVYPWYPSWPWYNPPWYKMCDGSNIVFTTGVTGNTGVFGAVSDGAPMGVTAGVIGGGGGLPHAKAPPIVTS